MPDKGFYKCRQNQKRQEECQAHEEFEVVAWDQLEDGDCIASKESVPKYAPTLSNAYGSRNEDERKHQ
jgi:hypothetical protein